MANRYIRVVSLWIQSGQEAAFEAFERRVAALIARHGGRIDQAVRIGPNAPADAPFEVHVVSFPNEAAAQAYAASPEVIALQAERSAIIALTEVLSGEAVGPYDS